MGLVNTEKAMQILGIEEGTLKQLKRCKQILGYNNQYDEQSLYNYQISQEYVRKNGKNALIDRSKKRAPKMPKKRGKYKKVL